MMQNGIRGVILAAGKGSRILPLSAHYPKPLLPVCNKPVMQYQIEALRDAGVRETAIVAGHLGGLIRDRFGGGAALGVGLTYVDDLEPQGIASSLLKAEAVAGDAFVVFLGDIFFAIRNLASALKMLRERNAAAVISVVREETLDAVRRNFSVVCDRDGRITRVIEKPRDPPSLLKGCGLYVFRSDIFEAIRRTPRSTLRGEYEITDAVQTLIDMGRPVYVHEMDGWEINVTFPDDLLDCNLRVLRERGLDRLLGDGVTVCPDTVVTESVLGDGVTVEHPLTIDQSVVLAGTRLDGGRPSLIRRCIVGPDIACAAGAAGG